MFSFIKTLKEGNFRLFLGSALIGGLAAILDLILLYLLTEIISIDYFYSTPVAFLIATIFNYALNKYLNFKNESRRIFLQFVIFGIISLITLILNQIMTYVLVEYFGLWYMHSQIIVLLILIFWNFYTNKKITFNILK
jgi:putative flippase GtrA